MRIAAISDIHIRSEKADDGLIKTIRQQVEDISPDVFVIAGDISHKITLVEETLSTLNIQGIANLYVAGNHDIWFEEESGLGSLEKYSKYIGEACQRAGFVHLPDTPFVKDKTAFVGSIGWYDYSFRREDLEIPEKKYIEKEWNGSYWRDCYAIDWSYTDYEVTDLFNSKLAYDLETLPKHIESIVYVSHHLPFRSLTLYKNYLPWDFFSAFMGAESTGEILLKDKRVLLSISGHSHIRNKITLNGLTAITVPIGYGRPAGDDFTALAHDGIAVLDLDNHNLEIEHYIEGDICEGLSYSF